jgi:hypothetical protein
VVAVLCGAVLIGGGGCGAGPPSIPAGLPPEFLADTGGQFELFATQTGGVSRAVAITGLPASVVSNELGDGQMGEGGRDAFWTSVNFGGSLLSAETGTVVETPVYGGASRVVGHGVEAMPSPANGLALESFSHPKSYSLGQGELSWNALAWW